MINFNITQENIKEHNPNLPQIPDHPYRILIIWGNGSGKTNSLFNLIIHLHDIDKIYLYAKYAYETKYQFLKLVSAIFNHFFNFSPNNNLSKTIKNAFYFI